MKPGDLCRFKSGAFTVSSANTLNDKVFMILNVYQTGKYRFVDIAVGTMISNGWDYDTLYDLSKDLSEALCSPCGSGSRMV